MDRRWRALQRRAVSGDVEAEAHLLRARARACDVERTDLELAAFLGHPAARQVIPNGPRAERVVPGCWLTALSRFGPAVVCLAAVLAALSALPVWETTRPGDPRARRALLRVQRAPLSTLERTVARWSLQTCQPGQGRARDALAAAHHAADPDAPAARARWALRYAALARGEAAPPPMPRFDAPGSPRWARWTLQERFRVWRPEQPDAEPSEQALADVQRSVARGLMRWALRERLGQGRRT